MKELRLSREEAGKLVAEYTPPQDEILDRFCPLLRGFCDNRCVCFVPSCKVRTYLSTLPIKEGKLAGGMYTIKTYKAFCGNVMFIGEDSQ